MERNNTKTRAFRKPESLEAERRTRNMLSGFLSRRGFGIESDKPDRNGQTIVATTPDGDRLAMRVRICWRREAGGRSSDRMKTFSATQLLAKIKNGQWERSIEEKVEREKSHGITHFLLVQSEDETIVYAALIPLPELLPIWINQRNISERLIQQEQLGNIKKNHAMNGSSPTLWLQDDRVPRAREVAAALWSHPGVLDLARLSFGTLHNLLDEEGQRSENSESYVPEEGDWRQSVVRQILERRGQQHFRDILRERYGDCCLITGCAVLAVLEAAHIKPYRGEDDNHPENGLLLRADIHTLFDLDLIGIEPDRLHLELHPSLAQEYGSLSGKMIHCSRERRPSREALKLRYERFQQRLRQTRLFCHAGA